MMARLFSTEARRLFLLIAAGAVFGVLLSIVVFMMRDAGSAVRVERELWSRKFTMEEMKAIKKREKDGMTGLLDAAAWRYGGAGDVTEPVSGRREETGIAYVFGTMPLAFPAKTLSGSFGRDMGSGDCVLTKNLAFSLFGTVDAAGMEVLYQGRTFHVAAVINKREKLLLFPSEEGDAQFAAFSFEGRDRIKEKLQFLGLE